MITGSSTSMSVVQDVWISLKITLTVLPLTFLYCAFYVWMVSKAALVIAYTVMAVVQIALWLASFLIIDYAGRNELNNNLYFLAIFLMILALIMLCLICCFRKQIKSAIQIIDAAADMLRDTKKLMLINSVFFIVTVLAFVIWAFAFICLMSMGDITASQTIPQGKIINWD
jgi:heme/copper-type cytochrome/quinol oxidase subunit 4